MFLGGPFEHPGGLSGLRGASWGRLAANRGPRHWPSHDLEGFAGPLGILCLAIWQNASLSTEIDFAHQPLSTYRIHAE